MLRILLTAAAALSAVSLSAPAAAAYPDHPITLINPYAAGGPADVVARSLARALEKRLGQPVVVENKPGGGASIGTGFVARAKPDGYTLLLGTSAGHVVTPLMQKTTYDGIQAFEFCSVVAVQPIMLVVNPSRGIKTVQALIARAKAEPGKLSYGSAGVGGATHLGAELFQQAAHVQLNHIPYAGASPAINDAVGGQIDLAMLNLSASLPFIRQGRLVPLAYAASERSPLLPDVPTLDEAGVPGAQAATWYSLAAPAGTPADIVQTLSDTVRRVNDDPDYRRVMQDQAISLMALSPQDAGAYVRKDRADMQRLLGTLGLLAK
ncbi:tripartite tricarboxylate transporter substrate binding protein [Achromobacter mucicolens]|jgi:tripartite-type tricarboxylate transporter receptor subunit TctC|nr:MULTISPECIES: tripartite tricarboxylate transporter substrate binding protein [Achromobacter]MCP2517567.1 tripartite tricarboxylate transporter substrate binding protein [Achromobacter mucicolens]MDH1177141.1 tripartite tricarboxylate transporter substrate binding protein [Achromobacter mucicolens]MDH1520915.1 tripartite tricarboxylate transporter substrate binding protein [Achromobacter mucicolens]UAN05400.1 tripartite tricarboxylate transporter substrate binding protein [Achromobacter muci